MTESWHQNWRGLWLKWPQFLDGLFDLSETNFLTFGVEGSNCSSKMKSIDKTTWWPEEKEIMQKWSGVHTHLNGGDCEFHLTCNSCYSSCCSSPGCWWCLQPHRRSRTPGLQPRSTPDAHVNGERRNTSVPHDAPCPHVAYSSITNDVCRFKPWNAAFIDTFFTYTHLHVYLKGYSDIRITLAHLNWCVCLQVKTLNRWHMTKQRSYVNAYRLNHSYQAINMMRHEWTNELLLHLNDALRMCFSSGIRV